MTPRGELRLAGTSTSWALGEVTVLGRSGDADITLATDAVSRRHAEIRIGPSGATLIDLDSRNGTAVNGAMVHPGLPHRLQDHDVVTVGGALELTFIDPLATPAAPRLGRLVGVWIDPDTDDVWVDARRVDPPLSSRQLRLLKVLDDAAGRTIPRAEIVSQVWNDASSEGVTDDSVTALVKRLRGRLRDTSPDTDTLHIVRGHGIRLARPTDT